jgi:hypothetical protein
LSQAFSPGTIDEDINILQPGGFVQRNSYNKVDKLKKRLLWSEASSGAMEYRLEGNDGNFALQRGCFTCMC